MIYVIYSICIYNLYALYITYIYIYTFKYIQIDSNRSKYMAKLHSH